MSWLVLVLAIAVQSQDARDHFARGSKAYAVGEFETALAAFTAAYEAHPAPEILFNIGQCHFNLGRYDQAIFFYESYLRARPLAANADAVTAQLEEARKLEEARLEAERAAAEREKLEEQRRLEAEARERAKAEQSKLEERRRLEEVRARKSAEAAERARRAAEEQRAREAEQMWLWGGIGGATVLVVGGVITAAAILLQPAPPPIPPSGSLGAIDRRTGT